MLNPLRMNGKYTYNQGLESMKRLSVDITHEHLDRDISALEIEYEMKSLRNRKASGSDGIAGEVN